MKILFLTQYFPPEVGAPQNRLYEIAIRLRKKGAVITVLTAMPNYPKMEIFDGYKNKFYLKEKMDGMEIYRSFIFVSKNKNIFFRLLNYFSFVITSFFIGLLKIKRHDFIFCESPPLFLGITAILLSKIKRAQLIFNVSDLWPESAERLGLIKNKFILTLTTKLEEFLYRNSILITGQTQGIARNISDRFPSKEVYWLKNGVDIKYFDPETIKPGWKETHGFYKKDFLLLYAGILGYAQGLEIIMHTADKLRRFSHLKFLIVGSGPEKEKLLMLKDDMKLSNVYFFDIVSKDQMPFLIKDIDASIIPLKKINLFKGAIPSKIFEVMALAKPILLGVEGEAKELFIDEAGAGLFFEPENVEDLVEKILILISNEASVKEMGARGQKFVTKFFSRDKIADDFWEKLQSLST
jgi:glycosyltransferase involved in cell wall biosynthesis